MYVAVDDTDSMRGNCTTYLATEIIRVLKSEHNLDLIGNPRLVRLNPATPWKTRGNGSLVMRFGYGVGNPKKIGNIGEAELVCYGGCLSREPDPSELKKTIIPLVEKNRDPEYSDPGLLISEKKPSQACYWMGVRTILDKEFAVSEIEKIKGTFFELGCGRGLIGCVCGMAWRPRDSTFELLSYRPRERWGTPRVFDAESIRRVDSEYDSTFNSWEERFSKVAMVPSTPCPVMYGLRGDSEKDLLEASDKITTEVIDRRVVFLTNQGTDDHIIRGAKALIPNQSYLLKGTVASYSRHISGGHVFVDVATEFGMINCAAYEPSKEFRYVLDWLVPGDGVEVVGELRDYPRTLNIEKLRLATAASEHVKISNPVCPICTRTMKSVGKGGGYKCKKCGTKSSKPITAEVRRQIVPGWYEPPVAARRHLSKPLKRMGETQPVEFVNGRT